MIVSKSGTLAGVKRHDYLPFGEELTGGIGGRTPALGFTADSVRQKFSGYEADAETGLNFAEARYQSSVQGRFTSVDPLDASAETTDPQSFNRYSYALNNPTNIIDPDGLMPATVGWSGVADGFWGSGYAGGNGWGIITRPGLGIINIEFRNDPVYTARWVWFEYDDDEGGAHTYGTWVKVWETRSLPAPAQQLAWHQRGHLRTIGDWARGVANRITLGWVNDYDRKHGRLTPEEEERLENSEAYQTGSGTGDVLVILATRGKSKLKPVPGAVEPHTSIKFTKTAMRPIK